jgi:hypothetical protein
MFDLKPRHLNEQAPTQPGRVDDHHNRVHHIRFTLRSTLHIHTSHTHNLLHITVTNTQPLIELTDRGRDGVVEGVMEGQGDGVKGQMTGLALMERVSDGRRGRVHFVMKG